MENPDPDAGDSDVDASDVDEEGVMTLAHQVFEHSDDEPAEEPIEPTESDSDDGSDPSESDEDPPSDEEGSPSMDADVMLLLDKLVTTRLVTDRAQAVSRSRPRGCPC